MATSFPTSLQDLDATRGSASDTLAAVDHTAHHTLEDQTIEAIQTKLGIDSSADTNSIDYKLKNTSSINPGHLHTFDNLSDVYVPSPSDGDVLVYSTSNSRWQANTTSAPDASTTVKGVTKMSVAPASASSPIAVGDNDTRVPTQGENDALVGNNTDIAVGSGNKFVTQTGLQKGAEIYAVDSVGTDSYAVTLSPVPTSYAAGMTVRFKAGTANTGACTLNVNSLGAVTIKKRGSTDLSDSDIRSGQIVTVVHDGTYFQLQNPAQTLFEHSAGSVVLASSTSAATSTSEATYMKLKEIQMSALAEGTVTVTFSGQGVGSNSGTAYARIYVNGSAVGTERALTFGVLNAYSEDISINASDKVQIYGKGVTGNVQTAEVSLFYVKSSICEVTTTLT